jgi:alanyl-tRNA synthetase
MREFMTILHYLQEDAHVLNTQLFKSACDERGTYLVFDATIFHPQGGGQPSDTGRIILGNHLIEIYHVRKQEDEVRHYSADTSVLLFSQEALMQLCVPKRTRHSVLHPAGHLLAHVTEGLYPDVKAIKGHHFPGESYVQFEKALGGVDLKAITDQMDHLINKDLPVQTTREGDTRYVKMASYEKTPCAGTHVLSLGALKGMKLWRQKYQKGLLKISYDVENKC